ncbi:MAG: hypothetical protein QM736_08995 [Vicinamibacterales bacterium]
MERMLFALFAPVLFAAYVPSCRTPVVHQSTPAAWDSRMPELWERPANIADRDLRWGSWGEGRAPDPNAVYRFVEPKLTGSNPGMTVRDPQGRKWSVKQANPELGAEGPVEVTLARVLEAAGYHQPPVYYLPSFTLAGDGPTRVVPGGRFRLSVPELSARGEWSWQENPFVGSKPYQGLLVILLLFNSSDLKNSNNTLYTYRPSPGRTQTWYVVRDIGTALGKTGRIGPHRGDVAGFERTRFIIGMDDGYVRFDYHGFHQELVEGRITPDDVRWACELVGGLTDRQWHDAFDAGGFNRTVADRFIRRLQQRIREGEELGR